MFKIAPFLFALLTTFTPGGDGGYEGPEGGVAGWTDAAFGMRGTQVASGAVVGGGKFGKFVNDFEFLMALKPDGTWQLAWLPPISAAGDDHHVWTGTYAETKLGSGKYILMLGCPDDVLANAMYFLDDILDPEGDALPPFIFDGVERWKAELRIKGEKATLKIASLERGHLATAPVTFARKIKAVQSPVGDPTP